MGSSNDGLIAAPRAREDAEEADEILGLTSAELLADQKDED